MQNEELPVQRCHAKDLTITSRSRRSSEFWHAAAADKPRRRGTRHGIVRAAARVRNVALACIRSVMHDGCACKVLDLSEVILVVSE
jgi:hypothetical protein